MAIELPKDATGDVIQLTPAAAAVAITVDSTISSATTITLNTKTSLIEVTALNNGIFLKYGTGASASDFSEFIVANTTRHYIIPAGVTQISVIEETASAKVIVIEKS